MSSTKTSSGEGSKATYFQCKALTTANSSTYSTCTHNIMTMSLHVCHDV